MKYRFNLHDVRNGGDTITLSVECRSDNVAIWQAWQNLLARNYCDRVTIYRLLTDDDCGPIKFLRELVL